MATSATTYFANRAKLQIGTTDVLILKGIEVTVSFTHEELYGMGSIQRQGVARHTQKVDIRVRAAKLDVNVASSTGLWGTMMKALTPSTSPDGTVEDTNSVATFTMSAWLVGSDSPTENVIKVTVTEVYFENLPFNMPENDWVVLELVGHGKTASFANVAYPG